MINIKSFRGLFRFPFSETTTLFVIIQNLFHLYRSCNIKPTAPGLTYLLSGRVCYSRRGRIIRQPSSQFIAFPNVSCSMKPHAIIRFLPIFRRHLFKMRIIYRNLLPTCFYTDNFFLKVIEHCTGFVKRTTHAPPPLDDDVHVCLPAATADATLL